MEGWSIGVLEYWVEKEGSAYGISGMISMKFSAPETFTYSFLKNGLNRSIGIGKRVVELFSAETSLSV